MTAQTRKPIIFKFKYLNFEFVISTYKQNDVYISRILNSAHMLCIVGIPYCEMYTKKLHDSHIYTFMYAIHKKISNKKL